MPGYSATTLTSVPVPTTDTTGQCPGFITHLIQRCALNDVAAIDALLTLFHPLVLALLSERASTTSTDDLEIEVFVRLWRRAGEFDPERCAAVTWVMDQVQTVIDHDAAGVLSSRELEVVMLVAAGLSNREIGQKLLLSLDAVKTQLRSACRKIGATSRSQAVAWAGEHRDHFEASSLDTAPAA
jgi:DNA-binding CsgD family transcriptional regulator